MSPGLGSGCVVLNLISLMLLSYCVEGTGVGVRGNGHTPTPARGPIAIHVGKAGLQRRSSDSWCGLADS